jgi:predicted DNA-binding transcriptional regulator YafY
MPRKGNLQPGARMIRLLQMLWLLQAGRRATEELRQRFEVSPRTVFRDIQLLRNAGVPIVWDDDIKGYRLLADKLNYTQLEPIELVALAIGDEGLTLGNLRRLRNHRDVAVSKLLSASEPEIRWPVIEVLENLRQLIGELPLDRDEENAMQVLVESWVESAMQAAAKESQPSRGRAS